MSCLEGLERAELDRLSAKLALGEVVKSRVDGVSEGLLGLDVFDLVNVRVILIVDVDFACVDELPVTADGAL